MNVVILINSVDVCLNLPPPYSVKISLAPWSLLHLFAYPSQIFFIDLNLTSESMAMLNLYEPSVKTLAFLNKFERLSPAMKKDFPPIIKRKYTREKNHRKEKIRKEWIKAAHFPGQSSCLSSETTSGPKLYGHATVSSLLSPFTIQELRSRG